VTFNLPEEEYLVGMQIGTHQARCSSIQFITYSAQKADYLAKKSNTEYMTQKDRFYFNQFFPITDNLTPEFLQEHVPNMDKQRLLKDLKKKRCELLGVVGRRAFHIFDSTHRIWITNSLELGY